MTAELINFLRDRLSIEEHVAREATMGPWRNAGTSRHHEDAAGPCEAVFAAPPDRGCICIARTGARGDRQAMVDAEHIARHNPERILAEVEAKRRILTLHSDATGHSCSVTDETGYELNYAEVRGDDACTTLRLLALPYADHPYYRQEWRP
ncbi:DUF6221 family protein [Streptomyces sp. WM6349]|uniref:DUF6221 family protein n=1 Tax=Streptomyces sp. WM6349 TaxID=1415552 RepID=UPI00131C96E7|nr:DUF6221 family protein [Streptomyces sp. WM6349]